MNRLSLMPLVFFLPAPPPPPPQGKLSFFSLAVSCISTHENFTDMNYINPPERLFCSSTEQGGSIVTGTSWMNEYNRTTENH